MPEAKYNFKPMDESRTFAQQMLHAAQGTFNLVANGSGAERKYQGQNLEKNETLQSKEEVIRIVNESYDYVQVALKKITDDISSEKVKSGPFDVSRYGWAFKEFEHIAHHRGQCAVYLRLAGITPPQYQLF